MYAIVIKDDDNSTLSWEAVGNPSLGPGEVIVAVTHAGVNRADLMQRAGRYSPPVGVTDILGLECSGFIDAIGPGVLEWSVGDRVCALLAGGGYAQRVVCSAKHVLRVPNSLSLAQAAGLPEVWCTAWLNLVIEGGIRSGERVLIHAGASGVGTAAIQLCALLGNPCFVTAGSSTKIERCIELGAQGGWNRHEGSFVRAVRDWSSGGVDVILDPVGGAYLTDNLGSLATGGRLINIGLLGGRSGEVDLGRILMKRQRIIGSVLRSRSIEEKSAVVESLVDKVWPALSDGVVQPVIHAMVGIDRAEEAHEMLESNQTIGKVILAMRERVGVDT